MTIQEQYIERLKEMTIAKYGREILSAEECVLLAGALRTTTSHDVDPRALELMFVARRHRIAPRPSVLTALAQYVGFGDWSDFCSSRDVLPADDTDIIPVKRRWGVIILTVGAIGIVIGATIFLLMVGDVDGRVDSSAQQRIYTAIDERWRAIATEECNELRCVAYDSDVDTGVAVAGRLATLRDDIAADISAYAAEHDITIDSAALDSYATQIAERCINIYNCL